MLCPNCETVLGRTEAVKVALNSEVQCPTCDAHIHLESALHRYIVIVIVFGFALLVGFMAKSDGGEFFVAHLVGFVIGIMLASAYLQVFGRLRAK